MVSSLITVMVALYRAHIFTSSGALNVTDLGSVGGTIEYLVVAGGVGGVCRGGGGGAGDLFYHRSN